MTRFISCKLFAFLLILGATYTAQAAIVSTSVINYQDPASLGQVQVTSTIFDNYLGDFTKWQWDYQIDNISFEPNPGLSNGVSGFQLIFGAPTAVSNQYAPPGWAFNCCGTGPPFGAEFDITNTDGLGVPIGGTDFVGFVTPANIAWTSAYQGSWTHSWVGDGQVNIFDSQDTASGLGPLVPTVPVPAAVWLFGSALGLLGWMRRKTA